MVLYNADLHFHSPYAIGCSRSTTIPILAKEAKKKGLNLLTTADILHNKWLAHVKDNLLEEDGCYFYKEDKQLPKEKRTYFLLGGELESKQRVHHLLYYRNFEELAKFRKKLEPFSPDINKESGGRPRLSIDSEGLLNLCLENNILIGPAHVFTPYFGVYAHYDSLKEAYGKNYTQIKFLELGLSADTNLANKIPELKNIKFFSFSDSHSPMSHRIGREYVCLDLEKPNYDCFEKMLNDKGNNHIAYNVGFNPEEGKYNRTACKDCAQIYSMEDAEKNKYRCLVCKGIVKKGVSDRGKEIAIAQGNKDLKQLIERPEYKFLIPLAQLIQIAIKQKNIEHRTVIEKYNLFIEKHTELDIMLTTPEEELEKIEPIIAKYIISARNNLIVFKPGGAGFYGEPNFCFSKEEKETKQEEINEKIRKRVEQKTLF